MNRQEVETLAEEFLAAHPDVVEVITDTGGQALCGDYTRDLLDWLVEAHPELGLDGSDDSELPLCLNLLSRQGQVGIPSVYPQQYDVRDAFHWVLGLPGEHANQMWIIDLTARQYDERLPFPFVWRGYLTSAA